MSTEFLTLLPPPGPALSSYDHSLPAAKQPSSAIPPAFKDALSVRESVFVTEQHCALDKEVDTLDPRSWHWIAYASVGTTSAERRKSETTASRVAVGTVRLVPPPHDAHPIPGARYDGVGTLLEKPEGVGGARPMYDAKEPYVILGRLATLEAYRGLGLSKLLINASLEWARGHASEILPPPDPAEVEKAKIDGEEGREEWNGLCLVHAQKSVVGLWERFGFVRDEGLGTWWEEGIEHVGMWRRLDVKK